MMSDHIESESEIFIDWSNIDEYLADPPEYRFIDSAKVIPGKEAYGEKFASSQDWYFGKCTSSDPTMPAGFLMEAVMQTGVLAVTTLPTVKEKLMMFHSCDTLAVCDVIRPGNGCQVEFISTWCSKVLWRSKNSRKWTWGGTLLKMSFTLISPDLVIHKA